MNTPNAISSLMSPLKGETLSYPNEYFTSVPQFMSPNWEQANRAETITRLMELMLDYKVDIDKTLVYANNSHNFDHIVDKVLLGQLHFYSYRQSVILMEVQRYPNHNVYHCFVGCGNKAHLKESEYLFEERAKALGCKYISQSGRAGWARELKSQGWKHNSTSMYKEVV